jgi:phenylacetaldehyde dehydrogenase
MSRLTVEERGSEGTREQALARVAELVSATAAEADASGETLVVEDPAGGTVIARLASASPADVAAATARARAGFARGDWSRLAPMGRARVLWRAAELIEANAEELALLEVLDNGKPLRDARVIDIPQSAAHFRYQAAAAARLEGAAPATAAFDGLALVEHEPVGVVAAITPWNFPLLMAARVAAPALAAGNSVVLKPAEETPLTALRLAALLAEAGVPEGAMQVLVGDGETTGRALVSDPEVDQIAFTGGHQAARQIIAASTPRFARLSLELGGKSPAIVLPGADLDAAITHVLHGAFSNQGQNCCAATRVLIAEADADAFTDRLAAAAAKLRVGSGFTPGTELGPLISAAHRERVQRLITTAVDDGAELLCGGSRPTDLPPAGHFILPTVLDRVPAETALASEEVFGPVVFTQRFGDLDEAVEIANATPYGLAAGIFGGDLDLARRIGRRLEVGTVWINSYERFDAAVPFSGRKQSGYGQSVGGHGALLEFTAAKSYWLAGETKPGGEL